ncbi:unnamed protein product [Paramecium primaurelia]|uniref:DNA-directed RNA polymerase N-terminal domain-containing protein n=1 Tax=Paramecium primaurelia TaxID=5886 RepID=A0A8S1Q991_PARPR|nr:unnamed protein product [Paramecium primaurelia]
MIIIRALRNTFCRASISTSTTTSFPQVYRQKSQLLEVSESCKIINQLPHELIEQSCNIITNNFFPLQENYKRIIPKIEEVLKNPQLIKGTIFQGQDSQSIAEQIYEMVILIVDFADKLNIGFLTGDIHPLTFNIIQREIEITQDVDLLNENLRKSLFNIGKQYKLPLNGIKHPDNENPRNLFERQLIIEQVSNELALDKFQQVFDDLQRMSKAQHLFAAQKYIVEWFPKLCALVQQEQIQCFSDPNKEQQGYHQYITAIQSEKLAIIALSELMKEFIEAAVLFHEEKTTLNCYQIRVTRLANRIGEQIMKQHLYEEEQKNLRRKSKEDIQKMIEEGTIPQDQSEEEIQNQKELFYKQAVVKAGKLLKTQEEKLRERIRNNRIYLAKYGQAMPKDIASQIGMVLVHFLVDSIKFRNENNFWVPVLVQGYKKVKQDIEVAIFNVNQLFLHHLSAGMHKDNSYFMHLDRALPMIYPPAKWMDTQIGGYYLKPTNLIRIQDQSLQEDAAKRANLQNLYDILDNISKVAWRVNNKVLNIAMQVWEQGGGIAEVPKRQHDKTYVFEHQIKECKSYEEKYQLLKKIQSQRDLYSLQCDFTLKLGVALAFNGCSKIYFPHNMDFRGRLYPIPPHLNHMGPDIARGLLEFSEGKKLGKSGLRWLKIHLANKMGKDKLSMADREDYVDQNIDSIIKCAEDPIKYQDWAQLEDAWQSLAAMFDYVAAIKSPNPEEYVSHLHVHQDGSCNGLQHYAALGRDVEGATQVNLANTSKPGDVYTHVAGMVERRVEFDAKDPLSKDHIIALKLQNQIKRKIVKQTVMTSVYGVTFIGAREQIHRQLKDKGIIGDDDHLQYQASIYLARITLDAIKDLFEGAHKIKQWLIKCATIISNENQPVSWITPLGLPVIQPYRSLNKYDEVKTLISNVSIEADAANLPINKVKQRSAFPPNFIHSLDSTHLMYSSIECLKQGITFAAVHDSYWTHACHVDKLNELLRDQFVRLHSQPLLEDLRDSFQRRFPHLEFPPIPERGQFDLEKVKQSVYFFA